MTYTLKVKLNGVFKTVGTELTVRQLEQEITSWEGRCERIVYSKN